MGLERLAMVVQQKKSIYDTDLYQPIIRRAAALANTEYGKDPEHDRALRVIADHSRGATFLISDGVLPGNEGRSYVLRRILRRAIRHGRKLGLDKPFLAQMAEIVIEEFGDEHPNLRERQKTIARVLTHEEETFRAHPDRRDGPLPDPGLPVSGEGEDASCRVRRSSASTTPSASRSISRSNSPRSRASPSIKKASTGRWRPSAPPPGVAPPSAMPRGAEPSCTPSLAGGKTEFLGYDDTSARGRPSWPWSDRMAHWKRPRPATPVEILLSRTPFYGESGGQIGDTGTIRTETGVVLIEDTVRPTPDIFVHRGVVEEGFVRAGEAATAEVDERRRQAIRRNHTATHLLHRALRIVLGTETHQAGSLVAPDRLRFDFTALDAVRQDQLNRVGEIVNHEILTDSAVTTEVQPYADAVAEGAMALFGEKYGDTVRVVSIPGFSTELCGGTHVSSTGEIGPFLITSEGSVAAGVRRIEAVTGEGAVALMLEQQRTLTELGRELAPALAGRSCPGHDATGSDPGAGSRGRATPRSGCRSSSGRTARPGGRGRRHAGSGRQGGGRYEGRAAADRRPPARSPAVRRHRPRHGHRRPAEPSFDGDAGSRHTGRARRRYRQGGGDHPRWPGGGRPDLAEAGGKDPAKLDEALGAVAGIVGRSAGI